MRGYVQCVNKIKFNVLANNYCDSLCMEGIGSGIQFIARASSCTKNKRPLQTH